MTSSEIEKMNNLMKRKTEGADSSVYMSIDWMFLCGAAQGIEEIMIELGYEWDGAEFVEVEK